MIDPAFTLEKKVAVVVGAANGIGRAIALAFAAAGAAVACADVEEPGAKATAAEIEAGGARALPVPLDVTDGASCRAAVAATVQRFGGLDVLLYGAADSDRTATVLELDEAAWDRVIRVNLTGAFLMVTS
jgi:NAD(P)-dependent dehydrogenase (short-subunit alcohol dehydrogenase family)